jgi:phospholipid/cholesterol/gamma-HCH transport system substrate-binding protein
MDNASDITSDLSTITNNVQSGKGTIGRLIMDKSWRENFDSTFANLKEGSAGFKTLMDKANEIDEILLAIRTTIENTSNITADLSKITNNIQSGNGTIGKLLMDKSSGENFDSTMVNLKEGSAELKLLLEKAKGSWLLGGF